jgi:hypothetical protein
MPGLLIVWKDDRASPVPTEGRRGREGSHIGVALIDITGDDVGTAPIGLKIADMEIA